MDTPAKSAIFKKIRVHKQTLVSYNDLSEKGEEINENTSKALRGLILMQKI